MKLDKLLKEFVETYSSEAMKFIEKMCTDKGAINRGETVKGFNFQEGLDNFMNYIEGYAKYKVENKNNDKASSHQTIKEAATQFIQEKLFTEKELLYPEVTSLVEGYLSGVTTLLEKIDTLKGMMMEEDVDGDSIGTLNEFADDFVVELQESFEPFMNHLLLISGYKTHKKLFPDKKSDTTTFV